MIQNTSSPSLERFHGRTDWIAALLGVVALTAFVLFFQSDWLLAFLLFGIIGTVTFCWGFEYIPLIVFLQLAFSVELQITHTTRLTLPTEVLIPVLFLAWGITVLTQGKFTYRPSPLNLTVLILYFLMLLSLRYTFSSISTIKAIIRDTGYIVSGYYLIPKYIRSERHLKQILFSCLGLHTLLVLYGFATQFIHGFHIYGNIASPFFIEHCIYAAFVTISFAFLAAFFLAYEKGPVHFWLGMACALFGAAILLTFVRAAWISVFFLLLYYLYQFRKQKSAVDLIILMIVFLLISLTVAFTTDLGSLILKRIDTITDLDYVANLDRIDRWVAAWKMWGDHPYWGVGWGAYPDVYNLYRSIDSFSSGIRMGAHNIYIEVMAEMGIVGLIAYLLMIYMFFRRAILLQNKLRSRFLQIVLIAVQGAMITYLVHAFVNNLGPSDKIGITFWFMMGLVPTLEALQQAEKSPSSEVLMNPPHIALETHESD